MRGRRTLLGPIRFARPGAARTVVDPITHGARALKGWLPPTTPTRILRQSPNIDARAPPGIRSVLRAWNSEPEPIASSSFSAPRLLAVDRGPRPRCTSTKHPRLMTSILVPNLSNKASTHCPEGNKTRTAPTRAESLSTAQEPSRRAHRINMVSRQQSNLRSTVRSIIGSRKAYAKLLQRCRIRRSLEHKFEYAAVSDPRILVSRRPRLRSPRGSTVPVPGDRAGCACGVVPVGGCCGGSRYPLWTPRILTRLSTL